LLGVDVATVPETSSHRDLVHSLHLSKTSRVLLPLAAGYRADWADLLTTQGAQVTTVAAYRAHMGQGGDALPAMLWSGEVDAVAFNSENNVRYFAKRLQYEGGTLAMLDDVCVACIEPQTAAVARGLGLRVAVVPGEHTPEALATDLAAYFAAPRR
jgi:uroporphyrinogen-III synthase